MCALYCDTRDPSQAQQDTVPVPQKSLNGRVIRLHVSQPDTMAWASIDNATTGNAVWLDRSWDAGATWEQALGKATVPDTWTGTRTTTSLTRAPPPRLDPRLRRRGGRRLHRLVPPRGVRRAVRRRRSGGRGRR